MNSARFQKWAAAVQVAVVGCAILLFAGSPAKAAVAPGTVLITVTATLPLQS